MSGSIPYIGSKISLITTSDIRYEGILYTLNREESTIAVQSVRSFGNEGRRIPEVPMSNEIYDFIIFRGKDLKDLTVLQGAPERTELDTGVFPNDFQSGAQASGFQGGYGTPTRYSGMPYPCPPTRPLDKGSEGTQCRGFSDPLIPGSRLYETVPSSRGTPEEAKVPPRSEPKHRNSDPKDPKSRGRGKGGQKKPLFEVLRYHDKAEEAIVKEMRTQGFAALGPAELRTLSETSSAVYHFYLDFVNYCCPPHLAQSDEQQWEMLCKALKKHFEKDFGAQKPLQPQRPNNTLGDFITIEAAGKSTKKGAKVQRGRGRGAGRARDLGGSQFEPSEPVETSQSAGSWMCPRCTLRNDPFLLECGACGTSKQQAALWAEFPPLG